MLNFFLGTTKSGVKFERTSRHLNFVKLAFMKKPADVDFMIDCKSDGKYFPIEVVNLGIEELISFHAKALLGEVGPRVQSHVVAYSIHIKIMYIPPLNGCKRGRTDRITIIGKKRYTHSRFSVSIPIVLT